MAQATGTAAAPNALMGGRLPSAFRPLALVIGAFLTFGISTGLPYYNLPFFYDYFQHQHGWRLDQITLGFPLSALLTLWVGPLLVPRFSPRRLLIVGTGLTAAALFGFAFMGSSLPVYFLFYFFYTVGYILSGPIPHQILISNWFVRRRGRYMGIVYVGVGLIGGFGSLLVRWLTNRYGFETALLAMGACMFVVWPLALGFMRDSPSEVGQHPDGQMFPPEVSPLPPRSFRSLLGSRAFLLLLAGSFCSIASIGAINLHMKFVFRDAGYTGQHELDAVWTSASALILWSSIAGRLSIGALADLFSKKRVMTATYFVTALTILLLVLVTPARPSLVYVFAVVFGFSMGADYMLIPLMVAERFGLRSLARGMAIVLPVNTIGQTWCPFLVSALREQAGNYLAPMSMVFALAMLGALAIALIPKDELRDVSAPAAS